jgi:hypothetical protein
MFPAIKSDLITGPVIVGVRHNLPFEGDSLLLGNDLAGKKVVAEPIATNEPAETSEEDADVKNVFDKSKGSPSHYVWFFLLLHGSGYNTYLILINISVFFRRLSWLISCNRFSNNHLGRQ